MQHVTIFKNNNDYDYIIKTNCCGHTHTTSLQQFRFAYECRNQIDLKKHYKNVLNIAYCLPAQELAGILFDILTQKKKLYDTINN